MNSQHAVSQLPVSWFQQSKEKSAAKPARTSAKRSKSKATPRVDEHVLKDNHLVRYFKEVACLEVLEPEEEFDRARAIESLENELWSKILKHPGIMEIVLPTVLQNLQEPIRGMGSLQKSAQAYRSQRNATLRNKFEKQAVKIAQLIRANDVERNILELVLQKLSDLVSNGKSRVYMHKVRINTSSKKFGDYYKAVTKLNRESQKARNEFVQANLRLVVTIANHFNFGLMPFHDLIQEGNLGLIKAVVRYAYRRGY